MPLQQTAGNNIDCYKDCWIIATPFFRCLQNNKERDRVVPEEVIYKMRERWETPYFFEGWDAIILKHLFNERYDVIDTLGYLMEFDQKNPHHAMTLGQHLFDTAANLNPYSDGILVRAALLHDIGKEYTQTFVNSKGEIDNKAHYYNHDNVGAYETLMYQNLGDPLLVSILVNLHMKPYDWDEEKTKEKYRKLWGDELFNMVMVLHEADKNAH